MANRNLKKPIIETDKPKGKPVAYWGSSKEAAEYYNISQVSISYNVNGQTKQAKGHYFRFATMKEIQDYETNMSRIESAKSVVPAPVEPILPSSILPVEIIPEAIQPVENQEIALSPFYRLLQKSKKKFNENSE